MSFADIADLTDAQIFDLAYHETDKEGRPVRRMEAPEDLPPTKENQRAILWTTGKALGLTEDELQAAWLAKYPEG